MMMTTLLWSAAYITKISALSNEETIKKIKSSVRFWWEGKKNRSTRGKISRSRVNHNRKKFGNGALDTLEGARCLTTAPTLLPSMADLEMIWKSYYYKWNKWGCQQCMRYMGISMNVTTCIVPFPRQNTIYINRKTINSVWIVVIFGSG